MDITKTASLSQAAKQAAVAASAASPSTSAANTASSSTGTNALQSLGSNFNQFLTLLTTQLRNQDPTSPVNTDQFTQELVAFTGVQQAVATNTNLQQLIQLQQGSEVLQSAQVVGHTATVTSPAIALQKGIGEVTFQAPAAEPVVIAVANSAGQVVRQISATAQPGNNVWQWDGKDGSGNQLPDGAYGVAIETGNATSATNVPFSVVGTVTGLSNGNGGLQLELGAVSVGLSQVQSISTN